MAANDSIPASRHDLLATLTGARTYFDEDRKFQGKQYDHKHEAAVRMKRMLVSYFRAQNRQKRRSHAGTLTAEQRMIVRRVVKPMERGADLHMEIAKHDALAYKNLLEAFGQPNKKKPRNAFDPDK